MMMAPIGMIMIELFIPSLEKGYDFEINEQITADELIFLTLSLLKEHYNYSFSDKVRRLFSYQNEKLLIGDAELNRQCVRNGDKLFLL